MRVVPESSNRTSHHSHLGHLSPRHGIQPANQGIWFELKWNCKWARRGKWERCNFPAQHTGTETGWLWSHMADTRELMQKIWGWHPQDKRGIDVGWCTLNLTAGPLSTCAAGTPHYTISARPVGLEHRGKQINGGRVEGHTRPNTPTGVTVSMQNNEVAAKRCSWLQTAPKWAPNIPCLTLSNAQFRRCMQPRINRFSGPNIAVIANRVFYCERTP